MRSTPSWPRRWTVALVAALALSCTGFAQGTGQTTLQPEVDAVDAAIAAAGAQWTAGVTSMARLSAAERLLRCGTILRKPAPEERMVLPVGLTPPSFDWRQKDGGNWTSPIRDQGPCGSCWDFSAIGVYEALLNIGAANPAYDVDLSEQYILSCCPSCGNCANGGFPSSAFEFCRTTGAVTEACLPYSADDAIPCGSACAETPRQIGAWAYLSANVNQIKQAIYSYGPVSACFTVYQDFFYYTSGIYEHVYGEYSGGHAIVLVGWDDATQAWICKNSWGTDWGETITGQPYTPGAGNGGWFRIRWGNCNIESYETSAATLTTFQTETVVVTVLDQNGLGIEGVEVRVDCGNLYDLTGPEGTASFDLPASFDYTVVASHQEPNLLLHGTVSSPGALTLDCRTASYIAVTARRVNGSSLTGGSLVFEFPDCNGSAFTVCPLATTGGTDSFWVTPGVYSAQLWRWPFAGDEGYSLALRDLDLEANGSLVIDASTMPTARVSLGSLVDFTGLSHAAWPAGFRWAASFDLLEGDIIYSAGEWSTAVSLVKETSPTVTWCYTWYGIMQFDAGSEYPLSVGGSLALTAVADAATYRQGDTALISTTLTDEFANSFDQVNMRDTAAIPPSDFAPYKGLVILRGDAPNTSYTDYVPWLTVMPPTMPAIFDDEVGLHWPIGIPLATDAETGTYAVHASQETHQGTLAADSSFDVVLPTPDPYEPNDSCGAAHNIGSILPTFTSETAHFADPNEDWFSFQVTGAGLLVVTTTCIGEAADTVIWLYDACDGALLATNDDSGPGRDSRIELPVAGPGTYRLLIDQYGDNYGMRTEYSFTIELIPSPDVVVTGADPIVLTILEGATESASGLLSVRNDGQPGSSLGFRIVEQDVTAPTTLGPSAPTVAGALPPGGITPPKKALPPKVSEPGSEWTLLVVDPDEAEIGPGDIAYVYGQIHDGVLYFRVVSHGAWDDVYTGLGTYIWLDVDQDPATGCASDDLEMYLDDIGAEFCIVAYDGGAELYAWCDETMEWSYDDTTTYLSLNPNSNEFTVGIALSQLPVSALPLGASQGLDILCLNVWNELTDCAPDAGLGHATYPSSVGFLNCVPDEGTLAPADTSAVTLRVDASALSAGDSRRARLYFMSNDPDEILTRDVVINVIGGTPAVFTADPSGTVRADGSLYGSGFSSGSADIAEWVPVSEEVEAGDVLEVDPGNPGRYRKAIGPCSPFVAGIVSTEPGVSLGGGGGEGEALLALVGMVPAKACDENGPIGLGDLVVPSSLPGCVMRWDEQQFPTCTPVGKALQELSDGTGMILILLMR